MKYYKPYTRKRTLVRCLGPGKEHNFYSSDPATNRICAKCSAKLNLVLNREPAMRGKLVNIDGTPQRVE